MDFSEIHPVFLKQIEALAKNDMETLMEVFHPDIVSLRFQGPVVGRENLRAVIDDAKRSYACRAAQGHTMRPGCPVCQNRHAM